MLGLDDRVRPREVDGPLESTGAWQSRCWRMQGGGWVNDGGLKDERG